MPGHTKTDQRKELVDFFSRDKELRDQEARVTRAFQDRPSNVVEARKGLVNFFQQDFKLVNRNSKLILKERKRLVIFL